MNKRGDQALCRCAADVQRSPPLPLNSEKSPIQLQCSVPSEKSESPLPPTVNGVWINHRKFPSPNYLSNSACTSKASGDKLSKSNTCFNNYSKKKPGRKATDAHVIIGR